MNEDLLRFKNYQKYIFFDFETCGLNLGSLSNKPWQLAFLVIENGKISERVDYWLKWDNLKVSAGAARVTGWTAQAYKKKAVDPHEPLRHFEKYLYDPSYIKVGHNVLGFDVYIHGIYRRLLGKLPDYSYLSELIDTLSLAKAIKNNIQYDVSEDFLSWQYKLNDFINKKVKTSLTQVCKDYDIDFDPKKLHNALYDIEKNYEVFKKMIWDIEI